MVSVLPSKVFVVAMIQPSAHLIPILPVRYASLTEHSAPRYIS